MSFQKTVFILALVGATIPVAFANSGSTPVGGEKGFETHKMPITQSRAEVKKEAQAVRNHLATAHGVTQVNSEAGNALTQHSHSLQNGTLINTDAAPSVNTKPSLEMTDMERRQLRELYLN
jgi:hypothetical protein